MAKLSDEQICDSITALWEKIDGRLEELGALENLLENQYLAQQISEALAPVTNEAMMTEDRLEETIRRYLVDDKGRIKGRDTAGSNG